MGIFSKIAGIFRSKPAPQMKAPDAPKPALKPKTAEFPSLAVGVTAPNLRLHLAMINMTVATRSMSYTGNLNFRPGNDSALNQYLIRLPHENTIFSLSENKPVVISSGIAKVMIDLKVSKANVLQIGARTSTGITYSAQDAVSVEQLRLFRVYVQGYKHQPARFQLEVLYGDPKLFNVPVKNLSEAPEFMV
jgi:hypothetical protein